jgi:hypothetical protein
LADNFAAKDANGTSLTFASEDVSGVQYPKRINADTSGNTTPAGDATARPIYVKPTDATNDFKSGSATNIAAATSINAQLVSEPGQWTVTHAPAVNTAAVASKSAGAAGVRHVCTGVSINLASGGAPTATQLTVHLRDGATGAGSILASWIIAIPAVAGEYRGIQLTGLKVFGTAATAMTLEFATAGGSDTYESVTLFGHSCV